MTDDLLHLRDWLVTEGCETVAIESTGVDWKPVFNVLEGGVEVLLVNAREAEGYKARKTDVIDAEWLADLLRHGLLRPSFIPPRHIREVRELTRYRESLVRERAALASRIQKLVESGNIKLGQVASDAPGVSGRAMLRALVRRRRRRREDQRPGAAAAEGKETGTAARPDRSAKAQRWVLSELLEQYEQAEAALARVEAKIRAELEAAWAA